MESSSLFFAFSIIASASDKFAPVSSIISTGVLFVISIAVIFLIFNEFSSLTFERVLGVSIVFINVSTNLLLISTTILLSFFKVKI